MKFDIMEDIDIFLVVLMWAQRLSEILSVGSCILTGILIGSGKPWWLIAMTSVIAVFFSRGFAFTSRKIGAMSAFKSILDELEN